MSMPERILIVEDDPIFRSVIQDNLTVEGYRVDAVGDGQAALTYVRSSQPDLIVLDLTLPDCDGLELCPLLRRGGTVPIIILSARGQKFDRLQGLRLGADDYITKPTDMEELLERIKVVLRRAHPPVERLKVGRLTIDFRTQRATSGRSTVRLTFHEFKLLQYLAQRPHQVVHREELLTEVWGYLNPKVVTRSVDQTIVRLRKKVEPDPHNPVFIRTAPGVGYCLCLPDSE
jgi:two-component system alkaline phosphatase synthesis response regulator PhoP